LLTATAFVAYEAVAAAVFALFVTPYALTKMISAPAFRAGLGQRLSLKSGMQAGQIGPSPIWIQAVSLGEVKSVAPLVRRIEQDTSLSLFLTSTTATGYRAAAELTAPKGANAYFPLDFSPIVKRAITFVRPKAIVLFETEIWPNFIRTADSLGIPITIVNGRISEKSLRYYSLVPKIFKHVISLVSFFGMQSQGDAERALALGARPDAVQVCGNVKFDSAPSPPSCETLKRLRDELRLEEDAAVLVAGSTHEGEEAAMLDAYRKILQRVPGVRLVLAPRHPERFDAVESTICAAGFPVLRKSKGSNAGKTGRNAVILLDTVGELAQVYALASISFVGGSLVNIGGHNIIEPATMGKPVLFGPFMHHFEDVKAAFLAEDAAVCVADESEFLRIAIGLLENPGSARAMGEAASRVVEANRGATDRYYHAIEKYF
jgi:3-deoxy-D-manno-octulosonic-acid transferase